jgi:hypothetical protein
VFELFTQRFMCSVVVVSIPSVCVSFFVIIKYVLLCLNEKYLMHKSFYYALCLSCFKYSLFQSDKFMHNSFKLNALCGFECFIFHLSML